MKSFTLKSEFGKLYRKKKEKVEEIYFRTYIKNSPTVEGGSFDLNIISSPYSEFKISEFFLATFLRPLLLDTPHHFPSKPE